MGGMITPRRVMAVIIIVIGIMLVDNYNEVKGKAEDTMNTIFEPVREMTASGLSTNSYSFDPDEYLNKSFSKTVDFTWSWYDFEKDVVSGVSAIVIGLGLLVMPTFEKEREFYDDVFSFLT
ncbi:ABC-type multidrug transport system permease subunit [Paenibacillus forsythiae]|uniref:ABC-type multidrug transport system permease subunit n=1 Tax=Paenibacillus forsythiae TaxID=365616 RepID=A0ABU3H5P7_9BACL|nr:hypothetical protein [Paenibacillus forsythiae]MDT3426050.1 ABC-type multidrug transport system permease subunit [Paenibacillus forsythiae]